MIIQSFPDLTQEEYERRCRAMEEAGRKIRQSRSSARPEDQTKSLA